MDPQLFQMPEGEQLFRVVALEAKDWSVFNRDRVVKEWVRRLQSEIYNRSKRRFKDDGDWRKNQGYIEGLEFALGIPASILTEVSEEQES